MGKNSQTRLQLTMLINLEFLSLQNLGLDWNEAEITGTDRPAQRPVGLPFESIAGQISDSVRTSASVILAELQAPHVSPPHKSGGETWGDLGVGMMLLLILMLVFLSHVPREHQ